MTDIDRIIAGLERGTPDNALDVQVEVALFEPCGEMAAIRANSAGTKVIYTDHLGREYTHWAPDWSGMPGHRQYAIDALRNRLKEQDNA